jgi:hypothetical protein
MIKRDMFPHFLLAFGLSLLINILIVFALSRAGLFRLGMLSAIMVSITEERQDRHDTKSHTPDNDYEDTGIDHSLPTEDPSEQDIARPVTEQEEVRSPEPEDKTKTVDLGPDIRLEVPPLHEGLMKRHALMDDPKMPKSSPIVLLRHKRETLYYDLFWIGLYVGRARLHAERLLTDLTISSEVHSSQFISNFYRVEDYAQSIVLGGRPHRFRIKQIEGRYRSDKETFFDYDNGLITFVDYLKDKQFEHPVKEGIYWDVISGFYYLRSMPAIDKDNIVVDVFDSNKFIKVQIVILGREKIELKNGKEAETIKAKVVLKSEGLFQKVGDIIVWLSDDVERIPLKVETKVPVGKVTAELKEMRVD